eukprot:12348843-Alexandrium_andersonii.AAC.1
MCIRDSATAVADAAMRRVLGACVKSPGWPSPAPNGASVIQQRCKCPVLSDPSNAFVFAGRCHGPKTAARTSRYEPSRCTGQPPSGRPGASGVGS